jgi:hypothetical protein
MRNKTRQSQLRFHYFTSTRFSFPQKSQHVAIKQYLPAVTDGLYSRFLVFILSESKASELGANRSYMSDV